MEGVCDCCGIEDGCIVGIECDELQCDQCGATVWLFPEDIRVCGVECLSLSYPLQRKEKNNFLYDYTCDSCGRNDVIEVNLKEYIVYGE
jgi:hypothetical protein